MKPFITTSLTNYCNLGCEYCVSQSYDWLMNNNSKPRSVDFLDYVKFSEWVDKYWPSDTIINITGGEPTLHPAAEDAIRFLSKKHKVVVFSNGLQIPSNILDNPPDVFWNLTYHKDTMSISFENWISRNSSLLETPYRICYLSKENVNFESDYNIDFRKIGKGDIVGKADCTYDKTPKSDRFCLVTPDGLVYLCNLCGTLITAAKQPVTEEDMDLDNYWNGPPRKKNPVGNIYNMEYKTENVLIGDKKVRDCLKYKKCWAYTTQARIEYYAKLEGFI